MRIHLPRRRMLILRCSCDGTFSENCDSSRDYTDIAGLLTDQGASDTLSFMQEYWVDINGQNEQFWEVSCHLRFIGEDPWTAR